MTFAIEKLLRGTEFTNKDKTIILKGIIQIVEVDGILDPREKKYIEKFVTEFFPEANIEDESLSKPLLTSEDVKSLTSEDAKKCFVAFLTIAAYSDEDFSQEEKNYMKNLFDGLLPVEIIMDIQHSVRLFLYRRVVFSFALKNLYLHPEFATEMAKRFDISTDEAVEINQGVFNALMVLKTVEPEETSA